MKLVKLIVLLTIGAVLTFPVYANTEAGVSGAMAGNQGAVEQSDDYSYDDSYDDRLTGSYDDDSSDDSSDDSYNDDSYDDGSYDDDSYDDDDDSYDDSYDDDSDDDSSDDSSEGTYLGNFKLTAYCNCAECNGSAGQPTASGRMPSEGRTVAMGGVDFGTKLSIYGHIYTVEDTGTPYGHVDIFFESHSEAEDFGVEYADVYLVEE
jgi:3D (Asp-Asp-Asp) domain-containing protein